MFINEDTFNIQQEDYIDDKDKFIKRKFKARKHKYKNKLYTTAKPSKSFKRITEVDKYTRKINFERGKRSADNNDQNIQKANIEKPLHTFCARDKHKIYSLPWNLNTVVIR